MLCFRKPKTLRPLSKTALDLIEKYVFHDVKADKWSWLPSHASLGTVKSNDPRKFSPGGLNRLQAKLGVSDNKMNIIGNYLRVKCGRGSVVKLQEDLVNRNKLFNEDFEVKIIKQKVYEEKESDDSNENKINKSG